MLGFCVATERRDMKAGMRRLTIGILAGGLSAMVVSGCGNSDTPPDPEWTSTVSASIPIGEESPQDTPGVEGALSDDVVTSATTSTVTTAAVNTTTAPTTTTTAPPVTSTDPDPEATDDNVLDQPVEEVPSVTTTQDRKSVV